MFLAFSFRPCLSQVPVLLSCFSPRGCTSFPPSPLPSGVDTKKNRQADEPAATEKYETLSPALLRKSLPGTRVSLPNPVFFTSCSSCSALFTHLPPLPRSTFPLPPCIFPPIPQPRGSVHTLRDKLASTAQKTHGAHPSPSVRAHPSPSSPDTNFLFRQSSAAFAARMTQNIKCTIGSRFFRSVPPPPQWPVFSCVLF